MQLNTQQQAIVNTVQGNICVSAVPGSGKTRTTVQRIAHLLGLGVPPRKILAVTFTKKAAGEMTVRLKKLGWDTNRHTGTRVGTFHSLCWEIIQQDSPYCYYDLDEGYLENLGLANILGYHGMNWSDANKALVKEYISKQYNNLVLPEKAQITLAPPFNSAKFREAYKLFDAMIHEEETIHFDGMLYYAVRHLQTSESACKHWQASYDHILIDEFQDTNTAQFELAMLLSKYVDSFMIVGDPEQSVYGFREARREYMVQYAKREEVTALDLPINYRSCVQIVQAADKAIKNNSGVTKTIVPHRSEPGIVDYAQKFSKEAEAQRVTDHVQKLVSEGMKYEDMAVLYRVNAYSRAFEESFLLNKVPYTVFNSANFWIRAEITPLLAYLRIASGKATVADWDKVLNRPFRYISNDTKSHIKKLCRESGMSYSDAIQALISTVPRMQKVGLDKVLAATTFTKTKPDEVLQELLDKTGYLAWLVKDKGTDTPDNSRKDNVQEVIDLARKFETVPEFLKYVRRVVQESKNKVKVKNSVKMMSIHSAKGLEYPAVFLVGVNQGILPHKRSEDIEEERRLFYVALTRAMDYLYVSALAPSMFIQEAGLG